VGNVIKAKTGIELKQKLRRAMGWTDRRTWTDSERSQMKDKWTLTIDWKRGDFVATRKGEDNEAAQEFHETLGN
jgi:hypothetical protein